MNDLLYVLFVERLLQDSTIESAMKAYTVVKRSSSAKVNFTRHLGPTGVAGVDLQELMRSEDISDPKRGESVSSLSWKRRDWRDRTGK